ncbi:MAG: ribosome silencing factor [Magnetococcales bacterium]|nr:ribosome silencing factor [Magnetococcales bacterium]NGZ07499.1 ribosome silencing factor [Magnetococcales bacterium]
MVTTHAESAKLVTDLVKCLDNKKGQEIAVVDLLGRSGFADFFLIATATSSTHIATLANEVQRFADERRLVVRGIEGLAESAPWVLVDLGDVLVHLFLSEAREFYSLEKLWSPKGAVAREGKPKDKEKEKEKIKKEKPVS